MLSARPEVRNLREYHPPLACRTGMRLDFNENTIGCSPRVLERLRTITAEDLARYPERQPVEALAAQHLGLAGDQVLLTNGVDEAIHLLCEAYLQPGDEVVVVAPTFSMYEIYAAATGARVVRIQCDADFRFPAEDVLSSVTAATRLIAVASPNNPTGTVAEREQLLRIANAASGAAMLVDEAYYEFHGETVIRDIATIPNLFVARTFSKAYGLAGLRIGLLCGPTEQMPGVRRISSPYNVNSVALLALSAALEDAEYVASYVSEVLGQRERLASELAGLGLHYWPSHANFLLLKIGAAHRDFVVAMRQRGILVRDRSADPGCDGCVRITIGSRTQMDSLISALREVCAELRLIAKVTA
ncbi:MAG TPA: histidinol-phosphate transaminase [Bryocella sp.]|nr:histidinol-phosphate transaminase [Bryocella sp.]